MALQLRIMGLKNLIMASFRANPVSCTYSRKFHKQSSVTSKILCTKDGRVIDANTYSEAKFYSAHVCDFSWTLGTIVWFFYPRKQFSYLANVNGPGWLIPFDFHEAKFNRDWCCYGSNSYDIPNLLSWITDSKQLSALSRSQKL